MKFKLFNLSHEFSAPAAEDKPIFLPFGTWDYDGKISQTFTREAAERIANELAADVAAGNPGIPVYQGHPDVPALAAKYPDKGALGWVKRIDLSNEGCSLTVEWDRFPGKGFGWFSPYWFGESAEVREGLSPFRVVVGDREGDEKCAADPLLQQRDMGNFGPSLGGTRLFAL